jgi:hypothetical protein
MNGVQEFNPHLYPPRCGEETNWSWTFGTIGTFGTTGTSDLSQGMNNAD